MEENVYSVYMILRVCKPYRISLKLNDEEESTCFSVRTMPLNVVDQLQGWDVSMDGSKVAPWSFQMFEDSMNVVDQLSQSEGLTDDKTFF